MKIAIDLDNTITASKNSIKFFSILTNLLIAEHRIYIVTNRTPGTEKQIVKELKILGIKYDVIIITSNKADYILKENINVLFENEDEYFLDLSENITVFKIREDGNFSFAEKKWFYGNKTGINIDNENN